MDCKNCKSYCPGEVFSCQNYQPVYSQEGAVEFFRQFIKDHPELEALGLRCGEGAPNYEYLLAFRAVGKYSHPHIHILPHVIQVENNHNPRKHLYKGTNLEEARDKFLELVKEVYPQMCLDYMRKARPDVGWYCDGVGHIKDNNNSSCWCWPDSSYYVGSCIIGKSSRGTIADFLKAYNDRYPIGLQTYIHWKTCEQCANWKKVQ